MNGGRKGPPDYVFMHAGPQVFMLAGPQKLL